MRLIKVHCILVLLLTLILHSPSYAGSRQTEETAIWPSHQLIPFAKSVEKFAAAEGARVFLIARLGSPKSELPEGIAFTHVGLAVYSKITTHTGDVVTGYAIHNLYQNTDDLAVSNLAIDYPLDFFAGVSELKAGIIIPTQPLQEKLLESLATGVNKQLHNSHYSIIANPYSPIFQNCTEHILDILFASLYGTNEIAQIKVNQQAYFKAQEIKISPLKRLLAPMVTSEISTSDHNGPIKTATFTTIAKFLSDYALVKTTVVIDTAGIHELDI